MKTAKVKVTKKPNITKSKCYDVYLGRGNGVARRFGNRNYRKTIKLHKERYQQTKGNKQKARVAVDITDAFESKGATFYYKPQKDKDWEVAPRSKVLKTIKQALREKASAADKSEDEEEKKMGQITINGETVEAAVWELPTPMPALGDSPPNELRQMANVCQQQQARPQNLQYPSLFLDSSRTHSGGTIDNAGNNNNNEANDEDDNGHTSQNGATSEGECEKKSKQSNTDPKSVDNWNEPVQAPNEEDMPNSISSRSMLSESIKKLFVESIKSIQQDDSDSDSEDLLQPAKPIFLSRKKPSETTQKSSSNEEEKSTEFEEGQCRNILIKGRDFRSSNIIEQEVEPLYYRYPPQHQEVGNDGSDSEDSLQPAKPIFLKDMRAKDVSMLSFSNSDKEIKSAYFEVDAPPAQPSNNLPSNSKDIAFRNLLDKALENPSILDNFHYQMVDDAEDSLSPSKPIFFKDSSMRSFRSKNTGACDMSEVNLEDSFRSLNIKAKSNVNKEE